MAKENNNKSKNKIKIAPSILSADFGKLNQEINEVEDSADLIHVDVMDGHFVKNITIGPPIVKSIKTKKPLDVHLMIEEPEKYVEAFAKAGAYNITFHAEVIPANKRKELIKKIRELGCKASISINPDKEIDFIKDVLDYVDMVLLMTVFPGFGGQKFIMDVVSRIKELRKLKPNLDIEIDGGIDTETIKIAAKAGANVFVAGSAIFGKDDRKKAINDLRKNAANA